MLTPVCRLPLPELKQHVNRHRDVAEGHDEHKPQQLPPDRRFLVGDPHVESEEPTVGIDQCGVEPGIGRQLRVQSQDTAVQRGVCSHTKHGR